MPTPLATWADDAVIEVYALESGDQVYVGATSRTAAVRAVDWDHLEKHRGWSLTVLETVVGSEAVRTEHKWHEKFRADGRDVVSQSWIEISVRAGKKVGKKNLAKYWAELPSDVKAARAMTASRAAAAAGAYMKANAASLKVKFTCDSCGRESTSGGMNLHQYRTGHEGRTRLDV
jgi:hypothetical protein